MISKSNIAYYIILLLITAGFGTFLLTPVGSTMKGVTAIFSAAGFYLYFKNLGHFPKIVHQYLALFTVMTVISILAAYLIHQQSIRKGLATNISFFLMGMSLLLYYLSIQFKISVERINEGITKVGWLVVAFYIGMYITKKQFIIGSTQEEIGLDLLVKGLVTVVSFIYLSRYFQTNQFKYLLFAILFYSTNQLADFQRFIFVTYLLSIIIAVYYSRDRLSSLRLIFISVLAIPVLFVMFSTTKAGSAIAEKFSAVTQLYESNSSRKNEASVDARVWETNIAMESIAKHPITGVGKIASSEKERISKSKYFYITDIGLVGIMYSFGVLGIFIFLKQLWFTLKTTISRSLFQDPETTGYKLFLLYIVLHTLLSGHTIIIPEEFMLVIVLLELKKYERQNENEVVTVRNA